MQTTLELSSLNAEGFLVPISDVGLKAWTQVQFCGQLEDSDLKVNNSFEDSTTSVLGADRRHCLS